MKKQKAVRRWIVVHQLSTGRWFAAPSAARETYQRDKDFSVLRVSFPTRDAARSAARSQAS